jgi:hypothetical protein
MRRALPLLLLAACATPHVPAAVLGPGAGDVSEVALEVVSGGRRALAAPRAALFDEIARVTAGRTATPLSAVDAFTAAATAELEKKGVHAGMDRRPGLAVLRIALHDLEIRNGAAAGAVAFVSAEYVLVDAQGASLWRAVERRLPIRLGGPDLTRSEVMRVAAVAVHRALAAFPAPAPVPRRPLDVAGGAGDRDGTTHQVGRR